MTRILVLDLLVDSSDVRRNSTHVEQRRFLLVPDVGSYRPGAHVFRALLDDGRFEHHIGVVSPLRSRLLGRFDSFMAAVSHVRNRPADPVGCDIDNQWTVGEWCLGSKYHEEVREAREGNAVVGLQLLFQDVAKDLTLAALDVDLSQCASDGIEACVDSR